jgi:hypothetical protein
LSNFDVIFFAQRMDGGIKTFQFDKQATPENISGLVKSLNICHSVSTTLCLEKSPYAYHNPTVY